MIEIKGTDYGIESDDMNIILLKRFNKKQKVDGKWAETGEFDYKPHGYYPTLQCLLKDMVRKELKSTGFKDLDTVQNKINELYKYIDTVIK